MTKKRSKSRNEADNRKKLSSIPEHGKTPPLPQATSETVGMGTLYIDSYIHSCMHIDIDISASEVGLQNSPEISALASTLETSIIGSPQLMASSQSTPPYSIDENGFVTLLSRELLNEANSADYNVNPYFRFKSCNEIISAHKSKLFLKVCEIWFGLQNNPGSAEYQENLDLFGKISNIKTVLETLRISVPYIVFHESRSILGKYIKPAVPPKRNYDADRRIMQAFNTSSLDLDFAVNDLLGFLASITNFDCNTNNEAFAKLTAILQTSGMGKSRLVRKLGKWLLAIISTCKNDAGFPKGSIAQEAIMNYFDRLYKVKGDNTLYSTAIIFYQNVLLRLIRIALHVDPEFTQSLDIDQIFGDFLGVEPTEALITEILFDGFEDHFESITTNSLNYDDVKSPDNIRIVPFVKYNILNFDLNVDNSSTKSNSLPNMIENMIANKNIRKEIPPVVIVFDEAEKLLATYNDKSNYSFIFKGQSAEVDHFRLLRASLRYGSFFRKYCFVLVISTNSMISNFFPTPRSDPSLRPLIRYFLLPPYTALRNMDVFAEVYTKISKETLGPFKNLNKYLFGFERFVNSTSCGRPLMPVYVSSHISTEIFKSDFCPVNELMTNLEKHASNKYADIIDENERRFKVMSEIVANPDSLIQNVFTKFIGELLHSDDITQRAISLINGYLETDKKKADSIRWTILALSVVSFKSPSFVDLEEAVRSRAALLICSRNASPQHSIAYCSEGIMNACASWLLVTKFRDLFTDASYNRIELCDVFDSLCRPQSRLTVGSGDCGELAARFALLFAIFRSPINHKWIASGNNPLQAMYAPRLLVDFLGQLCGDEVADDLMNKNPNLNGSYIAFNHFQPSISLGDPQLLAAAMLCRGSARIGMTNQAGVDLFLPLVLSDGRLSLVMIQVKHYSDSTFSTLSSTKSKNEIFQNAIIENVFKNEDWKESLRDIGQDYLVIVMGVSSSDKLFPKNCTEEVPIWGVYMHESKIIRSKKSPSDASVQLESETTIEKVVRHDLLCRKFHIKCLKEEEMNILELLCQSSINMKKIENEYPEVWNQWDSAPFLRHNLENNAQYEQEHFTEFYNDIIPSLVKLSSTQV